MDHQDVLDEKDHEVVVESLENQLKDLKELMKLLKKEKTPTMPKVLVK
jgi:hypothetical protein